MITAKLFYYLSRVRMALNVKNILLFIRCHNEFRGDENYSLVNLIKSMLIASKDEKIVNHEGAFVVSSFLPPFPSRAFYQLFNAVPGEDSRFFEHGHARRTAPISMFIAVTDRCLYDCWHCSRAKREIQKDLPLETMKGLIHDLQDMGVSIIGLTGGDPLLRKDLEEIISTIDDRSISILYTTGQTLTSERARRFKDAGLFAMGISLDHHDEDVHNRLRANDNAYKDALHAANCSLDAGIYTMFQTVATKKMIKEGEVWNIIDLAARVKVHEVRILESMPTGKLLNIDRTRLLNQEERNYLIDVQKKANRSMRGPKVSVFAHTESPERFGCGAGTQHSYIDSRGNLNPCDFVPLSFGNVTERPVGDIWREMNNLIGVPRDHCLIHEIYKDIASVSSSVLPLKPEDSREICRGCKKMKKLPGFYSALLGDKYSMKIESEITDNEEVKHVISAIQ